MNTRLLIHNGLVKRPQQRFVRILKVFSLLGLALSGLPNLDYPAWGQSSRVLRIYLARHEETDWNAEHRLQGSTDTALDLTGLKQAAILESHSREFISMRFTPALFAAAGIPLTSSAAWSL
jgi:hypothetical protein